MIFRYALRTFAIVLLVATHAFAARTYDAIYVFGDSYCDVGNIYLATHGAVPLSPPYYHGRFSNGPIWVEHLAGSMHLPMLPSLAGGTDFAAGGAEVTRSVVTPQGTIPSVPQQIEEYLSLRGGHADPNALYIIEGGGNDILNAATSNPEQLGAEIALGIEAGELLLRRAGAKSFLIPNLVDVGQLPAAGGHTAFATAASISVNANLSKLLEIDGYLEGVRIYRANVFSLLRNVFSDPTHFGFANVSAPCLNPATHTVCSDPDHTLFWDVEHPTEFAHAFFAVAAEAAIGR